jgi:hypothetical protein
MYFKRPSFRRGGSTGIGQLTPRVKAFAGFPNFGVGQGDNTGYQEYMKKVRADRASGEPSGLMKLLLGERYTNPDFVSPFLRPDSPFFSNRTGFEFMNLGVPDSGSTTYITSEGPKTIEEVEDIKITSNSDNLTDASDARIDALKKFRSDDAYMDKKYVMPKKEEPPGPAEILPSEISMKESIEGEVDLLKDLLKDTGASKGEKALILAKAIKEPGTIADKLEVAGEGAVKLAKEERKQDKALILTAYKNYKAKELAEGKLTNTEKIVKNYVNKKLADKNNTKSKNKLELEAWEMVIKGAQGTKDDNVDFAKGMLAAGNIEYKDQLRNIYRYSGKKDAASQKKVADAIKFIKEYAEYAEIAGVTIPGLDDLPFLAEGGRVNRALGTPEMGEITETVEQETVKTPTEKIEATEVTAAENIEPMKEVPVMDFATLRSRLPKEITDDVVQLLANSKEALQDFYYINSQNDVSNFNTKYGVNLILPPQVLA